jgi:hypothetical protein
MDSLDELFSDWMVDLALARAKIHVPESYMRDIKGKKKFNLDETLYVKLDIDPTIEGKDITATQFDIRADQFEKSALNLLERIITSAGYSPQSFGLNIQGRAESGTALSMRERKSFATKNKKQSYWQPAVKKIVELIVQLYALELGGKVEADSEINVAFADGITNDISELSQAVKMR